jgi:hypothetical protein
MRSNNLILIPAALLALAATAGAQTTTAPPPVAYRVQLLGVATTPAEGGTVQFNAEALNRPLDAAVTVTYRGTGNISLLRAEVTGATDFTALGLPATDQLFLPNESFTFTIRYVPTNSTRQTAAIRLFTTETPATGRAISSSTGLNLTGVAPEFVFSYLPPPTSNATPIAPGGTIAFPATNVRETASATVVVLNRGTGPGNVGVISNTGAAFASLANPPVTVEAGRDLRFQVRYSPTVIENSTGSLSAEFIDRTVTFSLAGSSQGAVYSYDLISGSTTTALQPGATFAVPDVVVGEKSSVSVRVRNTGNADGRVTAIAVAGTGFTLTDSPFVPLTLAPGATATLSVTFTPTTPGRATGRLRVGDDTFEIVSNGLGASLTYSYVAGPVTTTISSGATINFPAAPAGGTSTVRFVITNTGTSPAAVNSVGVVTTGTVFAAAGLPALPATIAPSQTLAFNLTFAPTATGTVTGTLRVDGQSFTLSGLGNQPPVLPSYSFTGASGAQQPAQQPAVGLSLGATYPLTLRGTLTLAFNSEVFSNDPAVQFATSGRNVSFTIPAGQREAVFQNNATSVRLQTGTVAGSIVLTPSFTTDGGINLTPTDPPSLSLAVAPAAPRILAAQVTARTATGFQILVTGYTTARQITSIDLTFTPVSGENVPTPRVTIPAEPSFNAWYQSAASTAFGSQFTVTIPITLTGEVINATNLGETLKSVSVTLTNRLGTSPAVSTDIF